MTGRNPTAVSVIIPVHNAGALLAEVLRSVLAQFRDDRPHEILIVDDGSCDGAVKAALSACGGAQVVLLAGGGAGPAAALNLALAAARFPLVAQVDQDVVLEDGWLAHLVAAIGAADVAAVQGQYIADPQGSLLARVMGRDLQERYAALRDDTDHVCTGNVLYRTEALRAVGGFDASLGYGYDNDMSYRLRAAGYRLRYCAEARSTHQWREGLVGYARQQYGFGYGRLDLIAKHRGRLRGDSVSPALMMLHPILAGAAIGLAALGTLSTAPRARLAVECAAGIFALLIGERLVVGIRAAARFRDWVPLLFPFAHLVRDLAWVGAIVVWLIRRVAGVSRQPRHSMRPRAGVMRTRTDPAPVSPDDVSGADRSDRASGRSLHARQPSGAR
ncbi:MAG TPA: glycosyltransferase [Vicinamibacterales bacterium]|nr:glycosyltransferase [Vicinamibacterales bacterium]